jgi:hypothetical protein
MYAAEPDDGISYPPTCDDANLPPDALVVDDVGRGTEPVRQACQRKNFADGTFAMTFGRDPQGREASRIDLHQASGGYGAHYWFSTTKSDDDLGRTLEIKATWTLGRRLTTPAQVAVFYPASMAATKKPLTYTIQTKYGPQTHTVPWQGAGEHWVVLGTYSFDNQPSVTVSTTNGAGLGERIAFDAVAFVPQTGATWPGERVVKMVQDHSGRCLAANGDSTASGAFMVQRSCDGGFGENWYVDLVASYQDTINGVTRTVYSHQIRNRNSNLCLAIRDAGTNEGDVAEQRPCTGYGEQQWLSTANQAETGAPRIGEFWNGWSGMYLGVANCNDLNNAIVVQLGERPDKDCGGKDSSWKWQVVGLGEGS